jgi:hypothetical protein
MRETSENKILATLNVSEKAESPEQKPTLAHRLASGLGKPVKMLCTEVIVLSLTLYTAFAYAMIFSYFASSSYVWALYYGFD